jgi:drug/metabolite transporter (DMT)-like permease
MSTPAASGRGHLAMLAFSLLVAGSFSLGAMAAPLISPLALTAVRFVLAGVVVGALAALRGGLGRDTFAAPWRHAVLGGLLACYFVLMFYGLRSAPPVSAAAVFTLTPLMAAGFAWLFLRQILTRRMALALALGAAGALWVIFRGDPGALMRFESGPGEAIYLLGCVAHAAYAPLVRRLNRGEAALSFTFATLLGGAALLCMAGWADIRRTDWLALPAIVWIALIYLAVAASAASVVLLEFAAQRLPSAQVMAYTYLVPSWVLLWELALGRSAPPLPVLGGVGLTILALVLLLKDETPAGAPPGAVRPPVRPSSA